MAQVNLGAGRPQGWLERYFQLTANKTTVRTEVLAGLTTFMTMAYILLANPNILAAAGMDARATMMATALSAGFATLLMGLFARLPFALAPGMGLNAFFAFGVVLAMGIPWQVVLGAVFIDGVIFLVLSLLPVRERIIQDIPINLKLAISVAIGLFIAFIGLSLAGIVVSDQATKVALGDISSPPVLAALFGLLATGLLLARRVRGALLWGIILTTIVGMFIPVTTDAGTQTLTRIPTGLGDIVSMPDWSILTGTFFQLDILGALKMGLLMVIFTFTFVDLFDTAGTMIGVATKLGILDRKGSFPGAGKALISDSVGTIFGSLCGTSTVTTYVESTAGVAEGGRTGLTSTVVGLLFLVSIFFWPLATIVPSQATAPALIIVGLLMMEPVLKLNLEDYTEALPAFLTLILMPLTYSIAYGIVFGILSYTFLKLLTGRWREVSLTMWVLTVLFIAFFWFK